MAELASCFADAGYREVRTFLQSGNVLFSTDAAHDGLHSDVERMLLERFGTSIPVVLRSRSQMQETVARAPADHGSAQLRSEVIFVRPPLTAEAAFAALPELRDGVDSVALGPEVIYFSRVAARASKTRLTVLMSMPMFQHMTMRTWNTVTRLVARLQDSARPALP
jgi:uncharacterized protein (DUF1697 family)